MSRSPLHLDGAGWTSWIAVVRGTKLFYLWPTDLDYKAAFQMEDPARNQAGDFSFYAKFDPFAEQSPELEAKFAESGRAFGDELWDWEARDAFSAARSSPLPPVKPAECIVREGEMIVSWDNWHAALNLEASMAVTGNFIDKFTLPLYLWRLLTYSGRVRSWGEQATNVYRIDHVTFFDALKVVRNLSQNARDAGGEVWSRVLAQYEVAAADVKDQAVEGGEAAEFFKLVLAAMIGDDQLSDEALDALSARQTEYRDNLPPPLSPEEQRKADRKAAREQARRSAGRR